MDKITRCSLIIVRAKKINGVFRMGMAKPCKGCQKAIEVFQIRRVFYSTEEGMRRL